MIETDNVLPNIGTKLDNARKNERKFDLMKKKEEQKRPKIAGLSERIDRVARDHFDGNSVLMGERLGYNDTSIRHYRTGKNEPKIDFMLALHEKIGISFDWLLYGAGEMIPEKGNVANYLNEPEAKYRSFLADDFDLLETIVKRMRKRFEELSVPGQNRDKPQE